MESNIYVPQEEESDFSLRKMRVAFAVLLGTLFGSSILPMMAISLLLLPMTEEFGWSRTAFSGGLTAMMLAGAVSAPFLGGLVDKIGVRPMIIGGTVIVGVIVMALSLQNGALWQFYGGFVILGFCGSTAIGYSKVIGALFNKHRGKALAIFGVESSLAGAAAPLLIQYLITHFGWRGMFVGLGLIILSVVPILLLWLDEPGKSSARKEGGTGALPPSAPASLPGMPIGAVLRTRTFWFISLASLLAIGPAFGLMPHFIPYLTSRGFDGTMAVAMLSSMTLAMAFGTVVGGWAVDWAKNAWIAAPFSALTTVALAVFMVMSADFGGTALLIAAMATLGFAGGAKRPMGTFFQLRFFGLRSFGMITGIQSPFLAVGMGVSPLLVGWCYDRFGTYQPAFLVMTICMAVTIILYLLLGPYRYDRDMQLASGFQDEGLSAPSGSGAEGVDVRAAASPDGRLSRPVILG